MIRNHGRDWTDITPGLSYGRHAGRVIASTYVHEMVIHPRNGIPVAAAHGRGPWAIDVGSLQK